MKNANRPHFRVGIDIGGTFSDIVFLGSNGAVRVEKLASTPDDYGRAVLDGVNRGVDELALDRERISEMNHAFTVATNAILENRGARTALITTRGFKDILEIGRIRVPRLYDLSYQKPPPLVERRLRFEVTERLNFRGYVLVPLDMKEVEGIVATLAEEGVESVAIALLHSYANPKHERMIASRIREKLPLLTVTVSSELLPEMKEYERTSTTVINAYVRPVVEDYLADLHRQLGESGIGAPMSVMQSNGGLATVEVAAAKPIYCIESGPAAGVVGAVALARRLGIGNLMTLDMGGTTAKASMVDGGEALMSPEYEVGGLINIGHRLIRGSGYILRVPAIDLAEVGAGGGSIAWLDQGGGLQVGPRSAGARPGPACYRQGGELPTVTDANVVLGYVNPDGLLGGTFPIDQQRARAAVDTRVGVPLGLSVTDAAYGIHQLVNSNMARALRAVSSEQGRDPRRFTLFAFGGGGPVHAASLAEMLRIRRIVVPPHPGVFSAFGLLFADYGHHLVRTHFRTFEELDLHEVNSILEDLQAQGQSLLEAEGLSENRREILIQVDMKYVGQISELTINSPAVQLTPEVLGQLGERFEQEHEATYGYRSPTGFQMVNLRVIARGIRDRGLGEYLKLRRDGNLEPGLRQVFFGPRYGWREAPVVTRSTAVNGLRAGPAVIEEYDSTIVVPPDWRLSLDSLQNLVLEREES